MLVVLQTEVLESVNVVSKMLQAKDADLHRAVRLLKDIVEVLSGFRHDFEKAKVTAKTLADKWGAQKAFEDKARKARRHFDELCEDERLMGRVVLESTSLMQTLTSLFTSCQTDLKACRQH
jgi:hypothetical protein